MRGITAVSRQTSAIAPEIMNVPLLSETESEEGNLRPGPPWCTNENSAFRGIDVVFNET
jgi:hypothetical protein